MKTTKKLIVFSLLALFALTSMIPSTFSWYDHSGSLTNSYFGYSRGQDNRLPVSMRNTDINLKTVAYADSDKIDENNVTELLTADSSTSVTAGNENRYATKIYNENDSDIYVGLYLTNSSNDAKFAVGTYQPTVNEKSYAARAETPMAPYGVKRVYFEHRNKYDFWKRNPGNSSDTYDYNTTNAYDMNIRYYTENGSALPWRSGYDAPGSNANEVNYEEFRMHKCTYPDSNRDVYYYDLPEGVTSFFFYNDYYTEKEGSNQYKNRLWNRTPLITNIEGNTIYYLTGEENSDQTKLYDTKTIDGLVSISEYYKNIRMANNSSAKIPLTKDKHYTGSSIKYSVKEGTDNTDYLSVDDNGAIVYSKAYTTGNAVPKVVTKVTGALGDIMEVETTVSIPETVAQVPIIENVKVPKKDSVVVEWFAKNNNAAGSNNSAHFDTLFLTQ